LKRNDQVMLGVITTAFPHQTDAFMHRNPSYFWRKLDETGRKRGVRVIFFSPKSIDHSARQIKGWTNTGSTDTPNWKKITTRYPDVAYDNVFVHLAGTQSVLAARSLFTSKHIPLFNPAIGNKWSIEKYLRKQRDVRPYLPPTTYATSPHTVERFLKSYGTVYLKPLGGSGGAGIVELKRSGEVFAIRSERFGKNGRLKTTKDLAATRQFLRQLLSKRRYLVQKGLRVTSIDHQKVDYRITLYRDERGKWRAAGVTPKLARAKSIVTNSHAGGKKTTMDFVTHWFKQQHKQPPSEQLLIEAAVAAAHALQKRTRKLGLIGIDAALDEDNRIWLLDFNPKPGRDLLNREMLYKAADSISGYALYLSRHRSQG